MKGNIMQKWFNDNNSIDMELEVIWKRNMILEGLND